MPPEPVESIEDARVNEWVDVVRRAQLGPTVKLVALVVASYANPDGSKVFPGVARLAVQCGIDYRTARRALATLRSAGLIKLVRRGARRAGLSDEYRLILAEDLLERCDVANPAAERLAIERLADRQRQRSTGHPRPVEPSGDGNHHRSPVTHENGSTGHTAVVLQVTGDPPPKRDLDLYQQPPSEAGEARRNGAVGNPHTREGTDRIRMAAADDLTRWEREQAGRG